jgi:hypothetical protein
VDEPRSLNIRAALRFLFTFRRLLLFLLFALSACFSADPGIMPATNESLLQLARSVSQLRQLPLRRDVTIVTTAKPPPGITPVGYYGGMPVAPLEGAYQSLGLLPDNADLNAVVVEYRRIEQLVTYDDTTGRALLSRDVARLRATLEKTNPSKANELPTVLGIMTALQEQHFKWRDKIDSISLEDRRLTFRAIAAGDMVLTLTARTAGTAKEELSQAHFQVAGRIADEIDRLGAPLPFFFRQQLSFPYREGSRFVSWALRAKGWNGVNSLYANPPLSTAQILNPEKYFVQRQLPLRYFPPALMRRFKESPVMEQSVGQYLMRALLANEHGEKTADQLAAAWRGDQLFVFQDGANLINVWFSSWENETAAREWMRAYQKVLETRHGVRFEMSANGNDGALIATARNRRGWLLQSMGPVVVVVNAQSANILIDLAEQAWKDLEIEADSTVLPFESAGRPAQSFRRR